jgi:hypothetical protein
MVGPDPAAPRAGPLKHIPARVPEEGARALAEKKGFWARALASVLPDPPPPPGSPLRRLPRLEMVWMPYYIFEVPLEIPGQGEKPIWLSIDGHTGSFALFEMQAWLTDGAPEGPAFAPELPEDEAEDSARKQFLSLLLRQRGRQKRPQPGETRSSMVVHFPVWVYYFARRGKYIDVVGIDAVTGERCPSRRRAGILRAFELAAGAGG